jgi:hypothetical protein
MAKLDHTISLDRVKELIQYDPLTGIFTAASTRSGTPVGKILGHQNSHGRYWTINLDGRKYKAHRLAWLLMTGEWPPHEMDHINQNKIDNRWANLRLATRQQNMRNISAGNRNTSGVRGVCWHAGGQKWMARIKVNYRGVYLGLFDTIELAAAARREAELKYFGHFPPAS